MDQGYGSHMDDITDAKPESYLGTQGWRKRVRWRTALLEFGVGNAGTASCGSKARTSSNCLKSVFRIFVRNQGWNIFIFAGFKELEDCLQRLIPGTNI